MKVSRKNLGIKVIIFSAVLFAGYYFLFLAPSLSLPKAFLEAQNQFASHRSLLLENRVALVGLTKLNPASANFNNEKNNLLQTLITTNENALVSLEKTPSMPHISGAPSEFLAFLNNDLNDALPPLLEKERSILQEQQTLINDLIALDSAISNIFIYNASQDIGALDPISDKDELEERFARAYNGLVNITENLDNLTIDYTEISVLQDKIKKTQNLLQKRYPPQREIVDHFIDLREYALAVFIAPIKSSKNITTLTRQTNLILEYDFWLTKISNKQAQL